MGTTVSINTVDHVRPEQIVYFKYSIDYSTNNDINYLRRELRTTNDSSGVNDIRSVLDDHVGIKHQYYIWSLDRGYVSTVDYVPGPNDTVFDITDTCDIVIKLPDAALRHLSQMTGYNYLLDGAYSLEYFNLNDMLLVPKHWLTRVQLLSNVARLKYVDNELYYDQFRIFGSSKTVVATGSLNDILHRPEIDISLVTGIGIKYTKRLRKLCDVTIVCCRVRQKRKRY